jgi:catecholate siderophore receptor
MHRQAGLWGGVSSMALLAGLTVAVTAGGDGLAQTQAEPAAATPETDAARSAAPAAESGGASDGGAGGGVIELTTIEVEGATPANTLREPVALDRLPGLVQDTPQAINVISQELMREQHVETLEEVLRNVPGVTVSIGEGGGGMNGDQFRIRGLEAKNDVYVDGLRDFGVFTRDAFNYETVQVMKGPSSASFGMGTTGGAINTVSKTPFLADEISGTAGIGTDRYWRATADGNFVIGDTSAIRLNAMFHSADAPDRDHVGSTRFGFAPSIGFGIGTDTEFTLAYFFQKDDRVPDYGVPVIQAPGDDFGRPVTEFGIDRSNWYGNETDTDESNVHMLTARLRHEASDWLTIHNDTRIAYYDRYFTPSAASCAAACIDALFDNDPATIPMVSRGGPGPFEQETYGAQNITTAIAEFETGAIRHQLVGGIDLFYQHDERNSYAYSPARPTTSLFDPDPAAPYDIIPSTSATANKETEAVNASLFLSDRVWLFDELSVLGGVRVDHYDVEYSAGGPTAPTTTVSAISTQVNFRGSVIWEPTDAQTYYLSYATSSNPPGAYIAQGPTPLTEDSSALDPERHEIYEIGGKFSVLDGRLGLTASLFQIDKNNATYTDEVGDVVSSGDAQRIRGVELGASGNVTDWWTVTASYTYLDSEITDSTTAANVGNAVQYVPKNAAALWTTVTVSDLVTMGPGEFNVGGGVTYRDGVYLNAANTARVPASFTLDAMASYGMDNWSVQLNGYNLTDELNYDQLYTNRVIPSPGRTFILSVSATF